MLLYLLATLHFTSILMSRVIIKLAIDVHILIVCIRGFVVVALLHMSSCCIVIV